MTGRHRENLGDKFWRKVQKGQTDNDCWAWKASKFRRGYGQLSHGFSVGEQKNLKAHRVSYNIHFGEIPKGMLVCHSCDNTECTNPKHLFLGTWQDNARDMIEKGRKYDTSGENNGQAKITRGVAHKIRQEYAENDPKASKHSVKKISQAALGKKYGITQSVVSAIVTGEYWK